jgi:hypothetical protein
MSFFVAAAVPAAATKRKRGTLYGLRAAFPSAMPRRTSAWEAGEWTLAARKP